MSGNPQTVVLDSPKSVPVVDPTKKRRKIAEKQTPQSSFVVGHFTVAYLTTRDALHRLPYKQNPLRNWNRCCLNFFGIFTVLLAQFAGFVAFLIFLHVTPRKPLQGRATDLIAVISAIAFAVTKQIQLLHNISNQFTATLMVKWFWFFDALLVLILTNLASWISLFLALWQSDGPITVLLNIFIAFWIAEYSGTFVDTFFAHDEGVLYKKRTGTRKGLAEYNEGFIPNDWLDDSSDSDDVSLILSPAAWRAATTDVKPLERKEPKRDPNKQIHWCDMTMRASVAGFFLYGVWFLQFFSTFGILGVGIASCLTLNPFNITD